MEPKGKTLLQRNQSRCTPKARPPSGFFLPGPRRQVFVAGVEVKANRKTLFKDMFTLVPLYSLLLTLVEAEKNQQLAKRLITGLRQGQGIAGNSTGLTLHSRRDEGGISDWIAIQNCLWPRQHQAGAASRFTPPS